MRNIGDVNANGLRLDRKTDKRSVLHRFARVWVVTCSSCGRTFRINGCDFHCRRCPECDGGAEPEL